MKANTHPLTALFGKDVRYLVLRFSTAWMIVGKHRRPPDAAGPSFTDALHNQLGIKLVAEKGPYDYLIVDHIERPTEN